MKREIEFKFRKLLSGNFFGMFRTIFKGEGLEVEDIRKYYYGDDPRYINWKVSVKFGDIFVNVFRQERDINVHLFVDVNKNFLGGFEEINLKKVEEFLVDFFIFSKKNGINVIGFLPGDEKGGKKLHVYNLGNNFERFYMYLEFFKKNKNLRKNFYISKLKEFLDIEKIFMKRRVIMIISDFMNFQEDERKKIGGLKYKNEIILVKIPVLSPVGKNYNFGFGKFGKVYENIDYILLN